MNDEGSILIG